jgi:uncharacterized repeat protein (TIGR01451 family)
VITAATAASGNVLVKGTFKGTPSSKFRLEFFAGANPGDGRTYLGFANVNSDAGGSANIDLSFPVPAGAGPYITATATDPGGNTSEFANSVKLAVPVVAELTVSEALDYGPRAVGSNLGYTFTIVNTGMVTVTNVTLAHVLPPSFNLVSATASQGDVTENGGSINATMGPIPVGASATLHVVAIPQSSGTVTLSATAGADQALADPSKATASGTATIALILAAPTGLAVNPATAADGSPALSVLWHFAPPLPQSAVTFDVYRSTSPGGEGSIPSASGLVGPPYIDGVAVPGQVYYYQVTEVLDGTESPRSVEASGAIAAPAPTTTTLTATPTSSDLGQTAALTAVVSPQDPSLDPRGLTGGTVVFSIDGTALPGVKLRSQNGQEVATLTTSALAAGDHVFTAAYSGGPTYSASNSSPFDITISRPSFAGTTTTLTATPTTSGLGQLITFTAVVQKQPEP